MKKLLLVTIGVLLLTGCGFGNTNTNDKAYALQPDFTHGNTEATQSRSDATLPDGF